MLPQTQPGLLAACADRLDSIVGLIAAGCAPSSQADPFGVRRDAYALLQVEHPCSLTSQSLDIIDDEGLVAVSCIGSAVHALYASCAHLKLRGDTTGRGQDAFCNVAFSLQSHPESSTAVWSGTLALQAVNCMPIVCWLLLNIGL